MLTRPHDTNCVECGRPYGDPAFVHHSNRIEGGPAYWSDRGLLCSAECSVTHFKRRAEEGDPMTVPADNPVAHLLGLKR